MYNSQYYTCEQIDQRLLQGYLDDYNTQTGQSLTKAQFLTKLGNIFSKEGVIDNIATQIGYYECDTAAGTAAKAITVANYAMFAGGSMKVKFANKNTANNATLNINSQGAKALYYQGERASATNSWDAEEVVEIYYDGTSYYANNVKGGSGSGVYDVSKEHPTSGPNSDGKFTLEYILNQSNVNELIPVNKRYPGMSIQFVSTSDSKYAQFRYMPDDATTVETFINPANWQGVDEEPTAGSDNLVKSGGVAKIIVSESLELNFSSDGYYISSSGAESPHSAYCHTPIMQVKKGSFFMMKNTTVTSQVSVISLWKNSVFQRNLLRGVDGNHSYFYLFDEDYDVIISTVKSAVSKVIFFENIENSKLLDYISAEFDNLSLEDVTGSSVQETQMSIALNKNDGTPEDPEIRNIDTITIPSSSEQKAGLMSADDKGILKTVNLNKQSNIAVSPGYIGSDGTVVGTSLLCTDYISLDPYIDLLKFYNTINNSTYAYLAFYDINKTCVSTHLLKSAEESILTFSIPKDAAFVRISIANSKKFFLRFIDIKSNLAVRCFKIEEYELQLTRGKYIETSGVFVTNASYYYSQIIDVNVGDVFTLAAHISNTVSVVSEWDENGNFVGIIIRGTNTGTVYNYVFDRACRIRICSIKTESYCHLFKNNVFSGILDLSKKVSQYDNLVLQEITPQIASSLVIGTDSLISVPVSGYKVAYYTATENCKIRIDFTRNNSYTHDGRVSKINGEVTGGTSTTTIHQFPNDNTQHFLDIGMSSGETVGIGYMPSSATPDVLKFSLYNYNIVNDIKEELNSQDERISDIEEELGFKPTDFSRGDMSAFKKILCIGDSLTAGAFNHDDIEGETWVQPQGYSYPDNLKRISGCDTFNAGSSGITSYGWYSYYSHQSHPERQEAITGFDCCIIYLGTNDDVDTLNTRSREAFINIIALVKSLNKQIKIFLSGMINAKSYPVSPGGDYETKDNFLRSLYNELYANDEQVFFLDMKAYGHLRDLESIPTSQYPLDNWNMGHLSAYGYWRLARDYYNYISYIMAKDLTNTFRDIQFTGTDYKFRGY